MILPLEVRIFLFRNKSLFLFTESAAYDAAIFAVGSNSNLRASDILRLTIGQVKDIKPGHEIEIIEKKTKKKRRITLNQEATTAIQGILADFKDKYKDTDSLFQGQRGPLTVKTVTQLVKKWCNDINLEGNHGSHTMRKTIGDRSTKTCWNVSS